MPYPVIPIQPTPPPPHLPLRRGIGRSTGYKNKFNDCKDHRNKKEVPDPIVKDMISGKIRKQNTLKKKGRAFRNIGYQLYKVLNR